MDLMLKFFLYPSGTIFNARNRLLYYPGYNQFLGIFEPMYEVYMNGTLQEFNKNSPDIFINAETYHSAFYFSHALYYIHH